MNFLLPIVLMFSSCAGLALVEPLLPTLSLAYDAVIRDAVEVGLDGALVSGKLNRQEADALRKAADALGDALRNEDLDALGDVPLDALVAFAESAIDERVSSGKISAVVARVLKLRLAKFVEDLGAVR